MKQKVLIIDGVSTILTKGSFLKDEIPRFLSKHLNEGYSLWLNDDNIGADLIDYPCVPFWLKQNLVFINKTIIEDNPVNFDKSSFIITNDYNRADSLKLNIKIYTNSELFGINKYRELNIADVILCFGFNVVEFNTFCKEANLLGYYDEKYFNKSGKNHDGLAFLMEDENVEKEYIKCIDVAAYNVKKNIYTIKHDEYIIGVSYKGQGVEKLNLNILNGQKLPLLLV
jgi:hypothetical protein